MPVAPQEPSPLRAAGRTSAIRALIESPVTSPGEKAIVLMLAEVRDELRGLREDIGRMVDRCRSEERRRVDSGEPEPIPGG